MLIAYGECLDSTAAMEFNKPLGIPLFFSSFSMISYKPIFEDGGTVADVVSIAAVFVDATDIDAGLRSFRCVVVHPEIKQVTRANLRNLTNNFTPIKVKIILLYHEF